jgi:glucosylceramidase
MGGSLRTDAYASYAAYLARFADEFAQRGVPIYAMSLQNEPHFEPKDYPGMRLTPEQRVVLLRDYVGPHFARRKLATRLLEWDHNWDDPSAPMTVLADSGARRVVSGVAWHCYGGEVTAQSVVHDAHPDKETWFTECAGGEWAPKWGDNLLWNARTLIVGATRHWARGVMYWNLALDENHGPHLGGCGDCRGVVTIDSRTGVVRRNVEYFVLAHASRFVAPGSVRVKSVAAGTAIDDVAFFDQRAGILTAIVVNSEARGVTVSVRAGSQAFGYRAPARSVTTLRWRARP